MSEKCTWMGDKNRYGHGRWKKAQANDSEQKL